MIKRLKSDNPRKTQAISLIRRAKRDFHQSVPDKAAVKSTAELKSYCEMLEKRLSTVERLIGVGGE